MAQKDDAFMVIPSYKALIGFPTGEAAVDEQNTRPLPIPEKSGEQPFGGLEAGYLLPLLK